MRFTVADSGSEPSTSTDSDSSEEIFLPPRRPPRRKHHQVPESVKIIRRALRHTDPLVDFEKKTREESILLARTQEQDRLAKFQTEQNERRSRLSQRQDAIYQQQLAEVQAQLQAHMLPLRQQEMVSAQQLKDREKLIWSRVEQSIRLEVEKEEKRQRAEQERRRLEEERRRQEEEAKRKADEEKKKQEEEARLKKELEERKTKQEEEERRKKAEQEALQAKQRESIGLSTADDDWKIARRVLVALKQGPMKAVKGNPQTRSEWGHWRRQITPKVGQLTDDERAIHTISSQLYSVLRPSRDHAEPIYMALLSSLSKAIILQAETEVTAKKEAAGPLAAVTFKLLQQLPRFDLVFFAKMVQRVGGWPVPCVLPRTDYDGRQWKDDEEKIKVLGYRTVVDEKGKDRRETEAEYAIRVAGIMRVFFGILKNRTSGEMPCPLFKMPRIWTWFARVMSELRMLESVAGAEVVCTALDVLGAEARAIWGHQFLKVLSVIYAGLKEGLGNNTFIGGSSPEGKAARVRVELRIEDIMR